MTSTQECKHCNILPTKDRKTPQYIGKIIYIEQVLNRTQIEQNFIDYFGSICAFHQLPFGD